MDFRWLGVGTPNPVFKGQLHTSKHELMRERRETIVNFVFVLKAIFTENIVPDMVPNISLNHNHLVGKYQFITFIDKEAQITQQMQPMLTLTLKFL